MGNYNYEAFYRNTHGVMKRPGWMSHSYLNDPCHEPLMNGYNGGVIHSLNGPILNALMDDRYLRNQYDVPNIKGLASRFFPNLVESDRSVGAYGNVSHIRGAIYDPPLSDGSPSPRPTVETSLSNKDPLTIVRGGNDPGEPPLAGMIFGCTSETYVECMQLRLFALPATSKNEVMRVIPGTKLFLYNYQERELSGIFEATSYGDMDIVPNAFCQRGVFPAQVRIRCKEKCPNLKLKAFKEAIPEKFIGKGNKFKYDLNEEQVQKLIALFRKEAIYWQRHMELENRKLHQSHLHSGLQHGYPDRVEALRLLRGMQYDPSTLLQAKRARMF